MKGIILFLTVQLVLLSVFSGTEGHRDRDRDRERDARLERRLARQRSREATQERDYSLIMNFLNELRKAGRLRDPPAANSSDYNSSAISEGDPTSATPADYDPSQVETLSPSIQLLILGEPDSKNGVVPDKRQSSPTTRPSSPEPTTTRYPPYNKYPYPSYTKRPPYDLSNVNRGVSTILNGVSTFRLSDILRGSFMFTPNENVRGVANTVIDSIFGRREEPFPGNPGDTPLLKGLRK